MTTTLEGGEGSTSRPVRSLPPGKTGYPLYRRIVGLHSRCGQVRKISPPPGFDPRTVQPVPTKLPGPQNILSLPNLDYNYISCIGATEWNAFILKCSFNPLNPELNPICYLLALLAHHFLHVSRIRVKSLTLRLLMSYIYMEHLFLMFLDHTQRRSTVGRTPLDE